MTLTQLRRKLPQYAIEDHPFDIGYFLRVAGQPCPPKNTQRYAGWMQADKELRDEAQP